MPRVSVLMPVYNSEKYLYEAVVSVLNQTYRDFEIIIVDDGSTDKSLEILSSFKNDKIKIFINQTNEKLAKTRNKCIEFSSGEYLANLDSDDIAEPSRLEKQVKFMDENPEVGVCGSFAKIIDEDTIRKFDTEDANIKFKMLFDSHFLNSSAIIRKSVLMKYRLKYDENFEYAQDYGLWTDIGKYCRFANIPEVLVYYRMHPQSITERFLEIQQRNADIIRLRQIQKMGISINQEEQKLHLELLKLNFRSLQANQAVLLHKWLLKLISANLKINCSDPKIFEGFFRDLWIKYVDNFNFSSYNPLLLKTVYSSPYKNQYSLKLSQKIQFSVKCLIFWKTKSNESVKQSKY